MVIPVFFGSTYIFAPVRSQKANKNASVTSHEDQAKNKALAPFLKGLRYVYCFAPSARITMAEQHGLRIIVSPILDAEEYTNEKKCAVL
jgi:hypothetical protein